jgi:hypothetical protein
MAIFNRRNYLPRLDITINIDGGFQTSMNETDIYNAKDNMDFHSEDMEKCLEHDDKLLTEIMNTDDRLTDDMNNFLELSRKGMTLFDKEYRKFFKKIGYHLRIFGYYDYNEQSKDNNEQIILTDNSFFKRGIEDILRLEDFLKQNNIPEKYEEWTDNHRLLFKSNLVIKY